MRNKSRVAGTENAPNQFIPASRYYGDRYPRTLEQAFGPGAKLSPPDRDHADVPVWIAMAAAVVALLCWSLVPQ